MEFYAEVRRSVYVEGLSERAAARRFGLARETVRKMLRYRLPPGYRRTQPIRCPKLDAFTGIIDQILTSNGRTPRSGGRPCTGWPTPSQTDSDASSPIVSTMSPRPGLIPVDSRRRQRTAVES